MRKITTGEDIKAWRKSNTYDQERLAKELGVTRQTIGNWESKTEGIPRYVEIALEALARYPSEFSSYIGKAEGTPQKLVERVS